jgi:hypothetical protein
MSVNILCDCYECGVTATTFGFTQPTIKYKVCRNHIHVLTDKHLSTFDIAAYGIIDSVKDAGLYEERREMRQKGLGNLSTLESELERNWIEFQSSLETAKNQLWEIVENCYREEWYRAQASFEETRAALAQRKLNFEHLLTTKHYQLSPQDSALCEALESSQLPSVPAKDVVVLGIPVTEKLLERLQAAGNETARLLSELCPQLVVCLDALLRRGAANQTPSTQQLVGSVRERKHYTGLIHPQQWPCPFCHAPTVANDFRQVNEQYMCHVCYEGKVQAAPSNSKTCDQCWSVSPIEVPDSQARIWHCPICLTPALLNP